MPGPLRLLAVAFALAACHSHPPSDDIPPPTAADEVELLPPPQGAPTWDSWAGAFVRDYCVQCHSPTATCGGSGCHSPGDPLLPDYRDKAAFLKDAAVIRCGIAAEDLAGCEGTASRTFPKWKGHNPLPTDGQRALMVEWLAAGAP
jgi:hypothetical protein